MTLRYYEAEREAFPRQESVRLKPWQAAALTEELLVAIGEPPARVILGRVHRNWDRATRRTRTLEYNPPWTTVLAVLHEVAHLWHMDHDKYHATAVSLLAEIMRHRT